MKKDTTSFTKLNFKSKMLNTIILENDKNLHNGSNCFTYIEIERDLENETYAGSKVVISSNSTNSYFAVQLAVRFNKTALINGIKYSFVKNEKHTLTKIEAQTLLVKLSRTQKNLENSLKYFVQYLMKKVPLHLRVSDVIEEVNKILPDFDDAQRIALDIINIQYNQKVQIQKNEITCSENGTFVKQIECLSSDLREIIANNHGKVIALSDPPGSGKSTIAKGIFEYIRSLNNDSNPVIITPTMALAESLSDDENFYQKVDIKETKSLVTCINTAVLRKPARDKISESKFIIIEEPEETLDACISDHMGSGTFRDKCDAINYTYDIYRGVKDDKSKVILITDATFSQATMNDIHEETGIEFLIVNIIDRNVIEKPIIQVCSHEQNIALCNEEIKKEDTATVISYNSGSLKGTHRTFVADAYAITESVEDEDGIVTSSIGIKPSLITSEILKTEAGKKFIKDPNAHLSTHKFIQFTSACTSGHNFTHKIDHAAIFSSSMFSNRDVIQMSGRPRNNKKQSISFAKQTRERQIDLTSIFEAELLKGISIDKVGRERESLKNHKGSNIVARRLQRRNAFMNDYANNILIAYEILGYKVIHKNDELPKISEEIMQAAKLAERIERESFYHKQLSLSEERDLLSTPTDSLSDTDKMKEYGVRVCDFYDVRKGTEKHKDALDFDKLGAGMHQLKTLNKLRSSDHNQPKMASAAASLAIVSKFFEIVGSDAHSFNFEFNADHCEEFKRFLREDKVLDTIDAKLVVAQYFNNINLNMKANSIVSSLLKLALGIHMTSVKNKNGKPKRRNTKDGGKIALFTFTTKSIESIEMFYKQSFTDKQSIMIESEGLLFDSVLL